MTTSDQHDQGPLTRKQLREIRLTGSTPVITEDTVAPAPQAPPVPAAPPAPPAPREAQPVEADRAPVRDVDPGAAPLTRRQARDQERVRTASVPIIDPAAANAAVDAPAPAADEAPTADAEAADVVAPGAEVVQAEVVEADVTEVVEAEAVEAEVVEAEIVSGVPDFASADAADDDDDDSDDEVVIAPVSASSASTSLDDVPLDVVDETVTHEASEQLVATEQVDDVDLVLGLDTSDDESDDDSDVDSDDVLADVDSADDDVVQPDERPTVNPAFGQSLLADDPQPFTPSFDDLLTVGDSNGSQHTSPSALIYTPSHGEGSLSGPVASTGEILVTGSYELPRGIGSQGHADGVADGKDIDAVLIDGELAPASSPTPIAASAAVSTLKPAGEVIRPPAPEKGNRLMLILAIVAGGLALALGVVLVVAFTTNVF